jgi:hypothetical protein
MKGWDERFLHHGIENRWVGWTKLLFWNGRWIDGIENVTIPWSSSRYMCITQYTRLKVIKKCNIKIWLRVQICGVQIIKVGTTIIKCW